MNIKNFLQSKKFTRFLLVIIALAFILLVFKAGEFVGFRKASFSYRFGERYYQGFAGHHRKFSMDFRGQDFLMSHGVYGLILKVADSTLLVRDRDNVEKTIIIGKNTDIVKFRDKILLADLKENDHVVVIGSPNNLGQIEAKLIRILPESIE